MTTNSDAMIVLLSSVGNPDFRQFTSISPKKFKVCQTLLEAQQTCMAYIEKHGLGGGNWTGGDVFSPNGKIAYISYNGRVWHPADKWQIREEYSQDLLTKTLNELT